MFSGFVRGPGKNKFAALDKKDAIEEVSLLQDVSRADDGELGESQRLQERHERLFGRWVESR